MDDDDATTTTTWTNDSRKRGDKKRGKKTRLFERVGILRLVLLLPFCMPHARLQVYNQQEEEEEEERPKFPLRKETSYLLLLLHFLLSKFV